MTNIYLTELNEEAIADFVKEQQGRRISGRGKKDLIWVAKDTLRQAYTIQVWTGPKRDDGKAELDTGLISLPKVAHQTQGTQIVRLQVQGPRSQCICCFST